MNKSVSKNKICVVTSSRADYGLLKNLILHIKKSDFFDLKLIVTGSHLSKEHGYTLNEILADKIKIDRKIPFITGTYTKEQIGQNVAHSTTKMISVISELKPNLILILGDRYDIFSAALASSFLKIPIAHIHGGEITEGAIDDMIRHCITKLSHFHFTSNYNYRRRVIQLGENPKYVFNVGSLGVENLKNLDLLNQELLEKEIGFKFQKRNIIVTYHPLTLADNPLWGIDELLMSLEKFKNLGIIFTFPNADLKSTRIIQQISKFDEKNSNSKIFSNLGQKKFFSCLKYCDGIIGNSSSGIIEAPSLNTWTINIGDRQKGRIKGNSIFDVEINTEKITEKLLFLLNKNNLKEVNFSNPYDKKDTAKNILSILKNVTQEKIFNKSFFDVNYTL